MLMSLKKLLMIRSPVHTYLREGRCNLGFLQRRTAAKPTSLDFEVDT